MVTQHWPAREISEEARKQREEGGEIKISRKRERERRRDVHCTIVVTMVTSRGFLEKIDFTVVSLVHLYVIHHYYSLKLHSRQNINKKIKK